MNLHEYQAKDLLRAAGLPMQPGEVASSAAEAEAIARRAGGPVVIKAQVHAGGRGKAGGVKLAATPADARAAAGAILGMSIKGFTVERVLVADATEIAEEAYVGIIMDRASKAPVVMVSAAGGMEIETVAATTPERVRRLAVDPRYGLLPYEAADLAWFLYPDAARARAATGILRRLYDAFVACGASLVELNPLVTRPDRTLVAVDAKMVIDENALARHPGIAALRDEQAEDPSETAARRANLTFVKLDGTVGCVVNGAGLAMATMDLVKFYGGEPANFLDIGGSSNPEKVVQALQIITADPRVRVILFNIFGGITRTDDVANGIVQALAAHPLTVPLVIRLTGTNDVEAVAILAAHGLSAMTEMDAAVRQAVALATTPVAA
jgi:succinyl-CoA synthetase beta subunit